MEDPSQPEDGPPLDLWGGVEPTFNRVGDRTFDQLILTGHHARAADLDLIGTLGLSAVRYPVIWERIAPISLDEADWTWSDVRLGRLRALGIRPIASLVHHGNGPMHTSLIDPTFPELLAGYARAVAERYPWIEEYTPINEPLTTARFSGLYGHWYPHARDNGTFLRILLTQCRAVVLAMEAIRAVNPAARLVQTDDVGRTHSTPFLREQADFQNQRRWLPFDLLCGRVDREHPLWSWLTADGRATAAELLWFRDHACPPDVIGIDHYLGSDRYLDQRADLYPGEPSGGNGDQRYVDVPAVRVLADEAGGLRRVLRDAWERYRLPLAVTEAHNGCTREEQMRWFVDAWQTADAARGDGIEVRAVTAWALFGLSGWDTLCTGGDRYEIGIFDARGPVPRPTGMVPLLRSLAAGKRPSHPVLATPGWWHLPRRFSYGHVVDPAGTSVPAPRHVSINRRFPGARPLMIVGADTVLGAALLRACEARGLVHVGLSREQLDGTENGPVRAAVASMRPWAVVNAGGYEDVDAAERDAERCLLVNADALSHLAVACEARALPLLTFSSDLVFDGQQSEPYLETDAPAPLSVYGRSKALGEAAAMAVCSRALVVRSGPRFGGSGEPGFLADVIRCLEAGREFTLRDDQVMSPVAIAHLIENALNLLIDGAQGVCHLTGGDAFSWPEFARAIALSAGLSPALIAVEAGAGATGLAPRPRYSVLGSAAGITLPSVGEALEGLLAGRRSTHALVSMAGGSGQDSGRPE